MLEYMIRQRTKDLNGQINVILEMLDMFGEDKVTIPENTLSEYLDALERMKNLMNNIHVE